VWGIAFTNWGGGGTKSKPLVFSCRKLVKIYPFQLYECLAFLLLFLDFYVINIIFYFYFFRNYDDNDIISITLASSQPMKLFS
jgi:hypothetical protein